MMHLCLVIIPVSGLFAYSSCRHAVGENPGLLKASCIKATLVYAHLGDCPEMLLWLVVVFLGQRSMEASNADSRAPQTKMSAVINIQSQSNYWQKVEIFFPGAKEKITSSLLILFQPCDFFFLHNELHMNEQRCGQMTLKKGACCEKANMLALIPVFQEHFKSLSDE